MTQRQMNKESEERGILRVMDNRAKRHMNIGKSANMSIHYIGTYMDIAAYEHNEKYGHMDMYAV